MRISLFLISFAPVFSVRFAADARVETPRFVLASYAGKLGDEPPSSRRILSPLHTTTSAAFPSTPLLYRSQYSKIFGQRSIPS